MISEEQLAKWQALADAATPGPWEWLRAEDAAMDRIDQNPMALWSDDAGCYVLRPVIKMGIDSGHLYLRLESTSWRKQADDFDLIAAARTALPALLAEVRRLRTKLATEREAKAEELPLLREDSTRAILLSNEIVTLLGEDGITGIGIAARLMELSKMVRAAERAACEKIAEYHRDHTSMDLAAKFIVIAIRARSSPPPPQDGPPPADQ